MFDKTTICAISSPPGQGAIALVRLSGENALVISDLIFHSPSGKKLANQPANTLHFGKIVSGSEIIDEVVVSVFRAPHSFTGEDTVEISCHGSFYIQQRILELLILNGAEAARPGEFTLRAFMNGKMDLSQAEAVADLIASSNAASHRLAMSQMRGGFSKEINNLRDRLLHFTAMIELELDFSEEDVEFADRRELRNLASEIEALLRKLKESFQLGNVIKNGIPVAIVGDTNVGKSTLLNALLNDDKAIVSEIHGTTRDVIEDVTNINGTLFRFFDTAGIRETSDHIETLGIERTYHKLGQASIVLLVVDAGSPYPVVLQRIGSIREKLSGQSLIIVGNKSDVALTETKKKLSSLALKENEKRVFISAKQRANLEQLIVLMQQSANLGKVESNDVVVTNARHYEILKKAHEAIVRVLKGIDNKITGDFLAQDIRECLHYLSEITGEISTHEVLGHIFKNFCIGK
jgi:tRNA modification GTPase